MQVGKTIETMSAAELLEHEFEEPKWAVPKILPQGLNILAGKPKHGKSIMASNIGIAVSNGKLALGAIEVENGPVLYLALEDTARRIHTRLKQMLAYEGSASNQFLYAFDAPRMNEKGLEALEEKINEIPDIRLVIIDTLAKFTPSAKASQDRYRFDYDTVSALKDLADRCNVSFLVIHHLRKTVSEDRFDDISGTFGVTGAADGILLLIRKTGQADAELHVTGRDVESAEYALKFDNATLSWNILGEADQVKSTEKKQAIFDTIKTYGHPISPKEIAEYSGLNINYVKKTLPVLLKEGHIQKAGHGNYIFIDNK
jgi:RecA-family ATPase